MPAAVLAHPLRKEKKRREPVVRHECRREKGGGPSVTSGGVRTGGETGAALAPDLPFTSERRIIDRQRGARADL